MPSEKTMPNGEMLSNSEAAPREKITFDIAPYLVDTHCHLHDREFFTAEQAEAALSRAHERKVDRIICIGTNHADSLVAQDFAKAHQNVFWTYGIHPENAGKNTTAGMSISDLDDIKNSLKKEAATKADSLLVGIGEVGLDYHYAGYNREAQIRLLEEMLQLALDTELPVSFHVREAFDDFLPVVANFARIKGVVHSFSDNKKNLKRILEQTDLMVGVNGMATYSTLPTPPLERTVLETDAPFLAPKPYRGTPNESGYVVEIAEWLAEKLGLATEEVAKATTANAKNLFWS